MYLLKAKNVYQLMIVGLISGLLTTGFAIQFSAMALCGLALAAYLYSYAGYRPLWRLLVFAFTTTVIGFIGAVVAAFLNLRNWNQWTDPPLLLRTAVISGGFEIGSVLLIAWALLRPRPLLIRPAAILTLLGLIIVGVFVADIGWRLGPSLGMWMWHGLAPLRPLTPISPRDPTSFGPFSFGLITQAGCAALVGLALWQNDGDTVPQSEADRGRIPPFWPAYMLVAAGIVAIAIGAKKETSFAGQLAKNQPSTVSEWITKPRSFDQVFIKMTDGDMKPTYNFSFASDSRTQTIEYYLRQRPSDISKLEDYASVTVKVSQFPNAEWASFELRSLPTAACLQLYPKLIHKRTISGQVILTCSFIDDPNFYWASNDTNIEIRFRSTPVSEELLKSYLDRYPAGEASRHIREDELKLNSRLPSMFVVSKRQHLLDDVPESSRSSQAA